MPTKPSPVAPPPDAKPLPQPLSWWDTVMAIVLGNLLAGLLLMLVLLVILDAHMSPILGVLRELRDRR